MKERSAPAEVVSLPPSRDGRLVPYLLITLGGMGGALAAGEPAFVGLALPFALALVLGLRRTGPVTVGVSATFDSERVVEGDHLTGRLVVEWEGEFEADVMLHRMDGVEPVSAGGTSWSFHGGRERVEIPLELEATRWGRHGVGEVWVRLSTPLGLLFWTGKAVPEPALRVLPREERLERMLPLPDSRAAWGSHPSRRLGDGHEFAELRPYVPGDRLRDLNWTATARRGRPFVNRYHPEMAGELVVVVDAFWDGSAGSAEALSRAARAAWALISVHLRENDRVGLAGLGASTEWLGPRGGRFARYKLLDTLLRMGREAGSGRTPGPGFHPAAAPPSTLIVVVSPLADEATLHTLRAWRGRGRAVAVALIDLGDSMEAPGSAAEALARRMWTLELEGRRRSLVEGGIPVTRVPGDDSIHGVVSSLRRMRRAPAVRRRR